jgi:hypothetical protein
MKDTMKLSKFLSRYTNLTGEDLKRIPHAEVKYLFPFLKTCSYSVVKNHPELLTTGKVVRVDDGHHEEFYYVPDTYKFDESMEFHRQEVDNSIVVDDTKYDYVSMSIYELKCLLVRKFNSSRNQRCARKELKRRGIELSRKYKRNNNI